MNTFVRPQTYHLYDVYIISAFQCVSYWTINEKISITFLLTNNFACTLSYSINVITGFCLLLRFLHLHFLFSVCFFSLFRISNNFWMWKNVLLKFYSLTLISFCIFIARFTQDDDVLVFFFLLLLLINGNWIGRLSRNQLPWQTFHIHINLCSKTVPIFFHSYR